MATDNLDEFFTIALFHIFDHQPVLLAGAVDEPFIGDRVEADRMGAWGKRVDLLGQMSRTTATMMIGVDIGIISHWRIRRSPRHRCASP